MNQQQMAVTNRQKRTKELLENTFIHLIKDKGFHAITVKNIIETAGFNRSTFYLHYQDKYKLAEELLESKMIGLEDSVGANYKPGQKVYTTKLDLPSFNIVNYIYENREFFELLNYPDTLPGLLTEFPARITKIYKEQFYFETINHQEVNMDYFKRYTSYGFYGLILDWVQNKFRIPQEDFIQEVIDLTKTHIYAFKYKGRE